MLTEDQRIRRISIFEKEIESMQREDDYALSIGLDTRTRERAIKGLEDAIAYQRQMIERQHLAKQS